MHFICYDEVNFSSYNKIRRKVGQRKHSSLYYKEDQLLLQNVAGIKIVQIVQGKQYNNQKQHPEVFLGKAVLKICGKFTGEHPCQSVISIKLLCIFIEITLRHGCSPVDLLQIFRTPFHKNSFESLLLNCANNTGCSPPI